MIEYIVPILTALGGLGVGGIITWFFGGRQANKATVDNDSHQREKDYFEMVDNRAEKEVASTLKKVIRCAKICPHSANCPVITQWDDEQG